MQSLHVQGFLESSGYQGNSIILDSRPLQLTDGSSLSMPYCVNTHMLSMDPDIAHSDHVNFKKKLEDWGFALQAGHDQIQFGDILEYNYGL